MSAKKILVRATNWIGDSVMSLPALEQLKTAFPKSHVCVLLRPWVRFVYEGHPAVDEILIYEKKNGIDRICGLVRVIKRLRKEGFDVAILFQNAFEAGVIGFFSGAKLRVGLDTDMRRMFLTHPVKRKKQHHIRDYLDIVSALGVKTEEKAPRLYLKEKYLLEADNLLKEMGINGKRPLVGFSPGAAYGSAKMWPAEYFARIAKRVIKEWNANVLLFGSKKETSICQKIQKEVKDVIDLSGKLDLGHAMGIIKRCALFLSNDSGLMHVASALGVPTIGIFGSTDPALTGPKGDHSCFVKSDISCSPCFKRECPKNLECLYSISPDQVWEKMEEMRDETSGILR
jgi:heptosyltransferase-2